MNTMRTHTVSPMLETDFYKTIHHLAYVPKLDYLVSYWTPRLSRYDGINWVVMFGLQGFIKEHLIDAFNENFFNRSWNEIEREYKRVISHTMGVQASDTTEMKKLHDLGFLPIIIKAVPEGNRVNIKTPMFEITNTVKGFGWLVNYLETYISVNIWQPMTAATLAYTYREIVNHYFNLTVENGVPSAACGDFSMRGMTGKDTAYHSSAAHLTSFTGTATIGSILWLEDFYNCDCTKEVVGKGVPSTEHSVMSSYGREGEFECYRHLIEDVFPKGSLSIVSDTYDYWKVITNYLPRLKDSIMKRDGKIIIRGDSGNPVNIICGELRPYKYNIFEGLTEDNIKEFFREYAEEHYNFGEDGESVYTARIGDYLYDVTCYHELDIDSEDSYNGYGSCYTENVTEVEVIKREITPAQKGTVELLWEIFGGTINSKGYKVLDPHISAIYGDSITLERAEEIYSILKEKGFAANNCTLGIGSWSYIGQVSRDTFGFALKATNSVVDGKERFIYKDPITDKVKGENFKKSQKGMCYVYKDKYGDILYSDGHTFEDLNKPEFADNLLLPVFRDSEILIEYSLSEIRNTLHEGKF